MHISLHQALLESSHIWVTDRLSEFCGPQIDDFRRGRAMGVFQCIDKDLMCAPCLDPRSGQAWADVEAGETFFSLPAP
jgi:hypothetical protein